MAPRTKPNSAAADSTSTPAARLPAETRRQNTSAAEPRTAAERPTSSEAELPTKKPRKPAAGKPQLISSKLSYKGNVFSVYTDTIQEPGDTKPRKKDVIRHNGSVVILAIDESKNPQDPELILIRQYRHAAGQFLLELPAGRIEPEEAPLAAAKREMIEETGFRARKWSVLTKYFASPGFLGEWMQIYLARGITPGTATPEEDEHIELVPMPLSHAMELLAANKLHDGKTIIGISLLHQAITTNRLPPL